MTAFEVLDECTHVDSCVLFSLFSICSESGNIKWQSAFNHADYLNQGKIQIIVMMNKYNNPLFVTSNNE
jgi:hypothetical protein